MSPEADRPTLAVRGVVALDERHVAVVVDTEDDTYLLYVYRAGLGIYWSPSRRRFEDRLAAAESHVASFDRIQRAVREELGIALRAAPDLAWTGIDEAARGTIDPRLR